MKLLYSVFICLISFFLASCVGIAPTKEVRQIDALNKRASDMGYITLDSVAFYANRAYREARYYDLGKAEACNHMGFYTFMKMDFERSMKWFQEVHKHTVNELELLIADIGMMKIYQRTARSKLFYDYRNSALNRMKRIDEDRSVFDKEKEKQRLNYAYSEFYIVSAIYFYYLQQETLATEAMAMLNKYRENASLWGVAHIDTNQLLYYKYIKGSTGLVEGKTEKERVLAAFDELYQTWLMARSQGVIYFEGNAAQGMANILLRPANFDLLFQERLHILGALGGPIDASLALRLGESALHLFKQYDDIYQVASAYVTLGKYYNYRGDYTKALDVLTRALNKVNEHHNLYYKGHHDTPDDLKSYLPNTDEYPTELQWMDEDVLTVPEWIARIREQLSVAYAGLENKAASDYNRNIYLDILDLVRQDKELESRFAFLQGEERFINSLLSILLLLMILLGGLFFWINRHSRRKTDRYLNRLEKSLIVCRDLTASLPQKNGGLDEIMKPIAQIVRRFLEKELGVERILFRVKPIGEDEVVYDSAPHLANENFLRLTNFPLKTQDSSLDSGLLRVYTRKKLPKEDVSFIAILSPYLVWAIENGLHFMDLGEERELLEKKLFITNQHNVQQKRENIMKRACMRIVYGIQPYLDRIRNEVHKVVYAGYTKDVTVRQLKYQYMDELLSTIQEYNEVLALWIKVKQGDLSLQITNFSLNELFDLLKKGARPFEQKELTLHIEPTDVIVKADRALTLFMINTLLENARKFTPEGGRVSVTAQSEANYVEIAVSDTGVGLSEDDIQKILHEKVYDSQAIGENNPEVKSQKGSGFGLMNCKAIIEKYRKTNVLFDVCRFDIESEKGKGSRFSFRLPYGVKKMLMFIVLFLGFTSVVEAQKEPIHRSDSIQYYLLYEASDFADAAYFSNKDQNYKLALSYVGKAMDKLNEYYLQNSLFDSPLMSLKGEGTPAEVVWWSRNFDTSYHIVLDIRNEAAIAYLALKDIDQYNYNNKAYTTLYKMLSKDDSLDRFCKLLERSTSNKRVALILLIFLIVSFVIIYYAVYIRQQLLRRWSLEQVLDINERIFSASLQYTVPIDERATEANLNTVPRHIIERSFMGINELLALDTMGIILIDQEKQQLFTTLYPEHVSFNDDLVRQCISERKWIPNVLETYIPLEVLINNQSEIIGVFYLKRRDQGRIREEKLFIELIVRYLATVLYNTMIRTAGRFRDISLVFDDIHRLEWENNQIHVQNRVLDNCLSAIKHETIYYPSRLKQVVDVLRSQQLSDEKERGEVHAMFDLVEYYKGVFTILSLWAKEELERATFRRTTLDVDELVDGMQQFFKRRQKKRSSSLNMVLDIEPHLEIMGDEKLVEYLLEMIVTDALAMPLPGTIKWTIRQEDDFVSFTFTDKRKNYSEEVLNNLFYPTLERIKSTPEEGLPGTTFLIAKEIIREHDEFVGRRGCRIRAFVHAEGGYSLYFTLTHKPKLR